MLLLLALVVVAAVEPALAGCSSGSTGSDSSLRSSGRSAPSSADGPATTGPLVTGATRPNTATTEPTPTPEPAALQFRPVVGSQPCSAVTPDSPDGPVAEGTTLASPGQPALFEADDGQLCYGLGPTAADGTDLTGAAASKGPNGWRVDADAKPASVAKLNALFDACYEGAQSCPATEGGHGYVALVLQDKVVFVQSVQTARVASRRFVIGGSFTRTDAQAKALAERLNI